MAEVKEGVRKAAEAVGKVVKGGEPIETGLHPHANQQMSGTTVWVVVAYLLLLFLVAGWTLWSLWLAELTQLAGSSNGASGSHSQSTWNWTPPPFYLGDSVNLNAEARLLLIVFLVGGLGGAVASFNSLANYRGEGALTKSWLLHYLVSPWLGAGVALLMYFVLRAGFLPGESGPLEGNTIPWGLVAITGLAGLFYDKALLKLQQVFGTVFNPQDNRGGKLGQLVITTTSLQSAKVRELYEAKLQAKGGQGTYRWSVTPELPDGLRLDPDKGTIQGIPTTKVTPKPYTFSVSDEKGATAGSELAFEVAQ